MAEGEKSKFGSLEYGDNTISNVGIGFQKLLNSLGDEKGTGGKILDFIATKIGKSDSEGDSFIKFFENATWLIKGVASLPIYVGGMVVVLNMLGKEAFAAWAKKTFPNLKKSMEANRHNPESFIQEHLADFEREPYVNEAVFNLLRERILGPKSNDKRFDNLGKLTGSPEDIVAKDREIVLMASNFIERKTTLGLTSPEHDAFVLCRVRYLQNKFGSKYTEAEIEELVKYVIDASMTGVGGTPPSTTIGADFAANRIAREEIATKILNTNINLLERHFFETSIEDLYPDRIQDRDIRERVNVAKANELTTALNIFPSKNTTFVSDALEKLYLDLETGSIASIAGATPDSMEDFYNQLIILIPNKQTFEYFFSQPAGVIDSRVDNIINDFNLNYDDPTVRGNITKGILLLNSSAIPTPLPLAVKSLDDSTANNVESLSALIQLIGPLTNTTSINPDNVVIALEWINGNDDIARDLGILRANGSTLDVKPSELFKIYSDKAKPNYVELQIYSLMKKYSRDNNLDIKTEAVFFNDYRSSFEYIKLEEKIKDLTTTETALKAKAPSSLTPDEIKKLADLATEIPAETARLATLATPPVMALLARIRPLIRTNLDTLLSESMNESISVVGQEITLGSRALNNRQIDEAKSVREFVHNDSTSDVNIIEIYSILGLPFNTSYEEVVKAFNQLQEDMRTLIGLKTMALGMNPLMNFNDYMNLISNGFMEWIDIKENQAEIRKPAATRNAVWLKINSNRLQQYERLNASLSRAVPPPTPPFIETILGKKNEERKLLFEYAADPTGIDRRIDRYTAFAKRFKILTTNPRIKEIFDTQLMFAEREGTLGQTVTTAERDVLLDPLRFEAEKATIAAQRDAVQKEIFEKKGVPKDENDAWNILMKYSTGLNQAA